MRFLFACFLFLELLCRPAYADGWKSTVESAIATPFSLVGWTGLIAGCIGFYFLPAVIAFRKGKENLAAIAVLNFFLGWTFIGWLVPLIWSLTNNGSRKTNNEVAGSVFGGYIAIFWLTFVPLAVAAGFYNQASKDKEIEQQRETAEAEKQRIEAADREPLFIDPGSIYESIVDPVEEAKYPGSMERIEFRHSGSSFFSSYPSTGIGYEGGYKTEPGNRLITWDLASPEKMDQTFLIERYRLIRSSDKQVFTLVRRGPATSSYPSKISNFEPSERVGSDSTVNVSLEGSDRSTLPTVEVTNSSSQNTKIYFEDRKKLQNEVQKLSFLLNKQKQIADEQFSEIQRLKNNLLCAQENLHDKDSDIKTLYQSIENYKMEKSRLAKSDASKPLTMDFEIEPSLEIYWSNVRDFAPSKYRFDVRKRIEKTSSRITTASIGRGIRIKFTIEKDGSPTNIAVLNQTLDEETRKHCLQIIEVAGPFRPLMPHELVSLEVETVVDQASNGTLSVADLHIAALGNVL